MSLGYIGQVKGSFSSSVIYKVPGYWYKNIQALGVEQLILLEMVQLAFQEDDVMDTLLTRHQTRSVEL